MCNVRRGVPGAEALIEGLLEGIEVRDIDRVVLFDIIPNRLGSFGGLFASNFQKVPRNKVASLVWEAWRLLSKHYCLFVLLGGNDKLFAFHAF